MSPVRRLKRRGYAKARRERNAAAGDCINSTLLASHGKATDGDLCRRCRLIHRHGKEDGVIRFECEQSGPPLRADHSRLLQGASR